MSAPPPGGHLYFRLDIILKKGRSKHTLNTYFSGTKIHPKYSFLHAFFLICVSLSFPKFVNMTKNIPFFPILHVFAPLNDVHAYIAWSWKTTLIMWIFLWGWYPTSNTSAPAPALRFLCFFPGFFQFASSSGPTIRTASQLHWMQHDISIVYDLGSYDFYHMSVFLWKKFKKENVYKLTVRASKIFLLSGSINSDVKIFCEIWHLRMVPSS